MSYESRRDRAGRRGRKGRILHTRISEELEEDLRRAAEELRVPVSNLVRNVLEEAVSIADAVSDEFGDLIDEVVDGAEQVAERFQARHHGRHRSGPAKAGDGERDGEAGPGRSRWTRAARAARDSRRRDRDDRQTAREPRRQQGRDSAPEQGEEPPILGWQPLVLSQEQRCDCGQVLPRGGQAHVALTTAGLSSLYRCGECIGKLAGS